MCKQKSWHGNYTHTIIMTCDLVCRTGDFVCRTSDFVCRTSDFVCRTSYIACRLSGKTKAYNAMKDS